MNKSYNLRGSYIGLDLIHTRADVIRATMEGITMGLRSCLDEIRKLTSVGDEMLLVVKTNIDQQAAALGAAACAAVGAGIWKDFERIDALHQVEEYVKPIPENMEFYNKEMDLYNQFTDMLCDMGDQLAKL